MQKSILVFANIFTKLATIAILHFLQILNDLFGMTVESEANSLSATSKFSPPCNTRFARTINHHFALSLPCALSSLSLSTCQTTITRVRGLAFEASRASARGEYPEERRSDVAVKDRNVAGIAQAFVLWKIDRHFTCLPTEGRKSSLARFFRAIYPVEIDSIETKGELFRNESSI